MKEGKLYMKLGYVSEIPRKVNNAGAKARQDLNSILYKRYGKGVANCAATNSNNIFEKIAYVLNPKNLVNFLKLYSVKEEYLVLQYPLVFGANRLLQCAYSNALKKNHPVLIVHDINILRGYGNRSLEDEVNVYNNCRAIIVHNNSMKRRLSEVGVVVPMLTIDLFDYLVKEDIPCNKYNFGKEVVFAGNIAKSKFLEDEELGKLPIQFNLYGDGVGINTRTTSFLNVKYYGSLAPDELPYKLKGSFGLIWDGNSVNTCDGGEGKYLKVNNPHKLSLYIVSAIPVIVWKEAAVAKFIEEHKIGITINSLSEISDKIDALGEEGYNQLLVNLKELQRKVSQGYYLNSVLDKVEKMFE